MTPLQVLAGTFPESECVDNRAEFMLRNTKRTYELRLAGRRAPLSTQTPGFDVAVAS